LGVDGLHISSDTIAKEESNGETEERTTQMRTVGNACFHMER
jgi:hypothetical protein